MNHRIDAMFRGAGSVQVFKSAQLPWPSTQQLKDYASFANEEESVTFSKEAKYRVLGMLAYLLTYLALLAGIVTCAIANVSLPWTVPLALSPMILALYVRYAGLKSLY